MWHAMPFSVLFVCFVGCLGVPHDSPFVMDNTAHASSAKSTGVDDTPFEVDDSISPFVVDDRARPAVGAQRTPQAASEVQAGTNDSPFVLDHQAAAPAAPAASVAPSTPSVLPAASAPFVFDTEGSVMDVATQSAKEQSKPAEQPKEAVQSKGTAQSKGTLTIVRNDQPINGPQAPRPPTTRMVMQMPLLSTTPGPSTSTALRFELGGNLLELQPGQMFVPIPDTPFEMERHIALAISNKQKQRKGHVELDTPHRAAVATPGLLVETHAAQARPHVAKRLMRNEELQLPVAADLPDSSGPSTNMRFGISSNAALDVLPGLAEKESMPSHSAMTAGAATSVEEPKASPVTAPGDEAVSPSQSTAAVSDEKAAAPISVPQLGDRQSALNVPAVLPSAQLPSAQGAAPTDATPLTVGNNKSAQSAPLSAPQKILNATISIATANTTNSTTGSKAVTTKGALVSIFLGLLVTVFFLSLLLCVLNAGQVPPHETEEKEPPRPMPPYRQLLKDQQKLAEGSADRSAGSSGNPPSV